MLVTSVLFGGEGCAVGRKILMGCGALSILGVLGIVAVSCMALLGGGDTDTASSPDPGAPTAPEEPGQAEAESSPPPDPAEPEGPRVGLNEKVTVGDVTWEVTQARQRTELEDPFGERKQGDFVVVNFDFTNNGSEQVTLDSESLELVDGEQRRFGVDTDNMMYVPEERDIFLQQVNPGVTRQGRAIFTVAPGASEFTLNVGDAQMFSDENGYVDLGF